MSDWAAGYVSDVEYLSGYYVHQEPGLLNLVCLINGYQPPSIEGGYTYCDLGCGFGETVHVLAAANPQSEFHGVDFNPAHIARAQAIAQETGLANITFHEADFDSLAKGDGAGLPKFDFIAAHGVYSWISMENRAALLAFIDRFAKPGAIVYLSYNSLPSATTILPVQWLLRECAGLYPGRSDHRFMSAIALLDKLAGADAHFLKDSKPFEDIKKMPRAQAALYGPHEYLNDCWHPCFFSDLAREAATAKLNFVGSAYLLHCFNELMFRPEQIALLDDLPDPILRETIKDFFQPLGLRRDIFVRGARKLSVVRQRKLLDEVRLVLKVSRSRAVFKVPVPVGEASLSEDTYLPVFDALDEGPKTLGVLFDLPELRKAKDLSPIEVAGMLVGSEQAFACFHDAGDDAVATAQRYNLNLTRSVLDESLNQVRALAAPVTGSGLLMSGVEPLVYLALAEGREPKVGPLRDFVWAWYTSMGEKPVKDGKVIKSKAGAMAHIGETIELLLEFKVPLWRQLRAL